jgi:hypothetical protein
VNLFVSSEKYKWNLNQVKEDEQEDEEVLDEGSIAE